MILDAAGDQGVLHAPGYLLVLAIILPVAGVLISFVLGGRTRGTHGSMYHSAWIGRRRRNHLRSLSHRPKR